MPKTFAIHPVDILLTEFMEPLGLTCYRLAQELLVPQPRIYELVRGRRSISADTAICLGRYFDLPPQFWLNLQNDYDLRTAKTAEADLVKPSLAA